jgi:trans-2,3-dihydro-3-hydroxyanthranilate isomerase
MKTYRIVYMDAFTTEPFSGNPCAVVPVAEGLTDYQMQQIARETNLSETAFVLPSDKAAVRVRYFMPHKEIPFAGHPTIATAFLLAQDQTGPAAAVSRVDFEFAIGVLPVEIHRDAGGRPVRVVMTQRPPEFGPRLDWREVATGLGLNRGDFLEGLPVQVVSTGVAFLVVPLAGAEALRRARMDRPRLQAVLERFPVDAAYLYCPGGVDADADLSGRLFSPAGSFEDPYTGAAVGAAAAHAVHHRLRPGPLLTVAQGHLLGRPGQGTVEILGPAHRIEGVQVGGAAVRTLEGFIYVDQKS